MGCASSKQVEAVVAVDVYRPPPTSIALFDINTIEEPWVITTKTVDGDSNDDEEEEEEDDLEQDKKTTTLSLPILEKLESNELAPKSWSEVSKALEEIKPTLKSQPLTTPKKTKPKTQPQAQAQLKPVAKNVEVEEKKKPPPPELKGFQSVKENLFILRDREEREKLKSGDAAALAARLRLLRRDPLEGYPEGCPPGNPEGIVLYTTTLRGVRRTFEDCEQARRFLEGHALDVGVGFEERDVSLHGQFLKELRELVGETEAVPRLFIRGKYVGGVDEILELSENGKLREMLRWVARRSAQGVVKGGKRDCEGCGGARFVPCLECNGSCKVVGEDGKEVVRCGECNENGLILCPICN